MFNEKIEQNETCRIEPISIEEINGVSYESYSAVTSYKELFHLYPQITECIQSAFGGSIDISDLRHHIKGDMIILARDKNSGQVIGFSSTEISSPRSLFLRNDLPEDLGCYMAAATVKKETQKLNIYTNMTMLRLNFAIEKGIKLLFTRTQNPRVEETLTLLLDKTIGKGKYSVSRIYVPNCYKKMLTEDEPIGKYLTYRTEINYDNGDAYIIFFTIL